ncbi:hypothetical protein PVL29_011712 [Vitis rotundifolia]|uniref:Protein kinase domain-containing protein n=1 Tax=Vitis rotundifolia TaxID=103349 RepID=A0AA39DPW0_VITRO|nr:hypothetical protein PVL29_011712 [Vitis rotundifolia]
MGVPIWVFILASTLEIPSVVGIRFWMRTYSILVIFFSVHGSYIHYQLVVGLDVARGVEYLLGSAHQSFIHRDLKPSDILLKDNMRAKIADRGLALLVPDENSSFETRIVGTLVLEYVLTGRVTTKVDVTSFGVILMELITRRKALDESQPKENMRLVTWYKRRHINMDTFRIASS